MSSVHYRRCAAPACHVNNRENPDINLHLFPKNPKGIASEILTRAFEDAYDEKYFYNYKREGDMDSWPKRKDDNVASFQMEAFKKLIFSQKKKSTTANSTCLITSTTTRASKKSKAKSTKAPACTTKKTKSTTARKKAAAQNSTTTASSKTTMTCSYGDVPTPMACTSNITTTCTTTVKTTTSKMPKAKTTARKNSTALPLSTAEDINKTTSCLTSTVTSAICTESTASSETTTWTSTSTTKKKKKNITTSNPGSTTTKNPSTSKPTNTKSDISYESEFKRNSRIFEKGDSLYKFGDHASTTSQENELLDVQKFQQDSELPNNNENIYTSTLSRVEETFHSQNVQDRIYNTNIHTSGENNDKIGEAGKNINEVPENVMNTEGNQNEIDVRKEDNRREGPFNDENKSLTNEKIPNIEQTESYDDGIAEKGVKKKNEVLQDSDYPEEKNVSSIKEDISDYIADIPQHTDEPEIKQTINIQDNNITMERGPSEKLMDYDFYRDRINAFLAFKKLNNNLLKDLYTAAEPITMNSKIFDMFDNSEGLLTRQRLGDLNKPIYENTKDDKPTYLPVINHSSDTNELNGNNEGVSDKIHLAKSNPFQLFNIPAMDTHEINDGIMGKLSEIFGLHKINKSENYFLSEPSYFQNNMSANSFEPNNILSNDPNDLNSYPGFTSYPVDLKSNYDMKEKVNKYNLNQPELDRRKYINAEKNVPTLESILQEKEQTRQHHKLQKQWNDNKLTTSNEYRRFYPFSSEHGARATYKNPQISQVTISNDINDKKILEISDRMPEFTTKPIWLNRFKVTHSFEENLNKITPLDAGDVTNETDYYSATVSHRNWIGSNKIFTPNTNLQYNETLNNTKNSYGQENVGSLEGNQFISTPQAYTYSHFNNINKIPIDIVKSNFELANITVPTTFVSDINNHITTMEIENNINHLLLTHSEGPKMLSIQSSSSSPYEVVITENQEHVLSSSLYKNVDSIKNVPEPRNYNIGQPYNKNEYSSTAKLSALGQIEYNSKVMPLSMEIPNITPMPVDMPPSLGKNDPEWKEWIPITVPKGYNSSNENKKKTLDTTIHQIREGNDYNLSDGIINMIINNPFEHFFKNIISNQDQTKNVRPILHKIRMNKKENGDESCKQEYFGEKKISEVEQLSNSDSPLNKLKQLYPIHSIDTNLNHDPIGESSTVAKLKIEPGEGLLTNQNGRNELSNSSDSNPNVTKAFESKIHSLFENMFKLPSFSNDQVLGLVKNGDNKNYLDSDDILHALLKNSMLSNIINNPLVNQSETLIPFDKHFINENSDNSALILPPNNQSSNIGQVKSLSPNGNLITSVKLSEINIVHGIPFSSSKEMIGVNDSFSSDKLNFGISSSKNPDSSMGKYSLETVSSTGKDSFVTQPSIISDENTDKEELVLSSKTKLKHREMLKSKLKGIHQDLAIGCNEDPNYNSMVDFLINKPKTLEHHILNNYLSSRIKNESNPESLSDASKGIPFMQNKINKFGWKNNVQSLIDENNVRYNNEEWLNNVNSDSQLNYIVNHNLGHLDLDRSALVKYLKKETPNFFRKKSQYYNNKKTQRKRNADQKRNFEQKMKSRELEYIIQRNLPTLPLNKDLFINYIISGMKKSGDTSAEDIKPQKYSKNEIQSVIDMNAKKSLNSNTETKAKMKPSRGRFMHRWPSNSSAGINSDLNKLF